MYLLFEEFIGDIVVSKKDRAVDGRRESFWTLVNSLLAVFDSSNPTNLSLFQNCKELTESGYDKFFLCYNKRKERLMQIYRQEVLKIDSINTKGRRTKEVIITKIKDLKNAEHISKKCPPQSEVKLFTITTTKSKKSWHVTTDEEKSILIPYLTNPNPSNEETEAVLESLLKLSSNY
ncbi:hypothetical protein C1645_870180 [Glomus cerebriforme]|uniref:Uncharacterized protein n=1 Tax=Glomus cerebriforme TaxID=658196 RepID=A0A397TW46_9GLOM|nr:hypothetical protein C1645_870180 [Glomus cerebriforme]